MDSLTLKMLRYCQDRHYRLKEAAVMSGHENKGSWIRIVKTNKKSLSLMVIGLLKV
jgi:hypothetical protein